MIIICWCIVLVSFTNSVYYRRMSTTQFKKEKAAEQAPHAPGRGLTDSTPRTVILPFFQNSPMQGSYLSAAPQALVKVNIMAASLYASVETGFYCSNIPSLLVSSRIASAIPKWFEHHGIHLEWARFVIS